MPTVYIESSIPSYYYETRRTAQAIAWKDDTRRWWDKYRYGYDLVVSEFVLAELERTPGRKRRLTLDLLRGIPSLEVPNELMQVVEYYWDHQLMPRGEGGDAFHLAMASVHKIDFLLTWNCRHLANANKTGHMRVLNNRLGLFVPNVTTPTMLIPEDE